MNPFEHKGVTLADVGALLRGILTAGICITLGPLVGVSLAILFIYLIVFSQPYRPTDLGIALSMWFATVAVGFVIGGMAGLLVLSSFTKPKPISSRFPKGVEATARAYFTLRTPPTEAEVKPGEGIKQPGEDGRPV